MNACVYWLFNASFDKVLKERDWISKGLAGLQPGIKAKNKSESPESWGFVGFETATAF